MDDYEKIESSNIAAAKHDPETDTLFVVFCSGAHWAYSGVSASVYDALVEAESAGRFFHRNIKNDYPARKVE